MSQFNLTASQAAPEGVTGEITTVLTSTNARLSAATSSPFQLYNKLEGDMKKGDIIFFACGLVYSSNVTAALGPSFTTSWTELKTANTGGSYNVSMAVHYHVLDHDSSGMYLGMDGDQYHSLTVASMNPAAIAFVLRGVDPDSISAVTRTASNTAYATFNPIEITSSDYILAVGYSGANFSSLTHTLPSDFINSASQNTNYKSGNNTLASVLLRKPEVSGSYTETTWQTSADNSAYTNATCAIKLTPL